MKMYFNEIYLFQNSPVEPLPKATTAGSSLGFEDNVCEDTLSSQSTYKINSGGCLYYKASIAPNPKLLNDFEPSKEQLETVYGGIMEEVNELRLQIASKKTLSAIDHQGKTINTNIDRNCDVLPLSLDDLLIYTTLMLKFCTNKPIWALLLRQFFWWGGKGGISPPKRV